MSRAFWVVLFAGLAVRLSAAFLLELGNDEVYYWTYLRYPDWSHFDHPGMLGWLGQLFTAFSPNPSDFGVRILPLVCGTINTMLVYQIAAHLGGKRAGLLTSMFFTASIYGSFLTGTFLLPDAPQSSFWLGAVLFAIRILPAPRATLGAWLALGACIAGALLSKYHSVFLITGIGAYVLFHARHHLTQVGIWLAALVSVLGLVPTYLWNKSNGFISFAFHGERVVPTSGVNWNTFFQEIGGEFAYHNPVVFAVIWCAIGAWLRGRRYTRPSHAHVLFWIGFPLLLTFLTFSLFRRTLPHWTGPAYLTLLPLAGCWLADVSRRPIPRVAHVALGLTAAISLLGLVHIPTGVLQAPSPDLSSAKQDVTLDMFGWQQTGHHWQRFMETHALDPDHTFIVGSGWFPTAHLDRYVGTPSGVRTCALGSLEFIHKYAWIHAQQGVPSPTDRVFYMTDSRNFKSARDALRPPLAQDTTMAEWDIFRGGKVVKRVTVIELQRFDHKRLTRLHRSMN